MLQFFLLFSYISSHQFKLLREKLSKKSFLSEEVEIISGKGAFAKLELKICSLWSDGEKFVLTQIRVI